MKVLQFGHWDLGFGLLRFRRATILFPQFKELSRAN